MQKEMMHIRKSIIPDISVKFLDLCLSADENGILMPPLHRESKMMEYRADIALKELISQKLRSRELAIPLAMRKRQLYMNSRNSKSSGDLDDLFVSGTVPIFMRKHLLCRQSRAG